MIIVETPGIGQGDAGIVPLVDIPLYVMTPEFGAASQLEKIDMLDYADAVAINKFDRKGAEDARRDVAKQLQRNRRQFSEVVEDMPVYGTIAANTTIPALPRCTRGWCTSSRKQDCLNMKASCLPLPGKRPVSVPSLFRRNGSVTWAR